MKHLTEMVRQHKAGKTNGIYAVCSAHPLVLEAAIRYASANQTPLLIEATSNQVDQFGGYTGMTPADFRGFVCQLADSLNFPQDALILGGDHLGPNRWQNLPAAQAMANADDLIKSYVAAGFKKIHLDCSMSCQDDPIPLTDDIVAERAARLAKVAEETCREHFGEADLEYVIGTEVPVPGGAHETLSELAVTTPDAARATLEAHRHAFETVSYTHLDVYKRQLPPFLHHRRQPEQKHTVHQEKFPEILFLSPAQPRWQINFLYKSLGRLRFSYLCLLPHDAGGRFSYSA